MLRSITTSPYRALEMIEIGRVRLFLTLAFVVGIAHVIPAHAANQNASISVPCFDGRGDAMPRDAYPLPVARAYEIQDALDQHRKVKLDPGADYAKRGGVIRLASGQELYGISGSKVARVVVEGGATNVVLQGVATEGINFPASEKVTRGNCFYRITGPVTIKDAKLEDNLFVDISNTQLDIDTRRSGYLRNNRFIRVMTHATYPALRMLGDSSRLSGGNVFLWLNILTPHGDGVVIEGQDDVTFVGLDAESWNWSKRATNPAMMTVTNTGTLRIIAANGGDAKNSTGHYLDAGADEVQIYGTNIERIGDPAIILRPQARRFFASNIQNLSISDLARDAFRAKAFTGREPGMLVRGVNPGQQAMSANDMSIFRGMLVNRSMSGVAWERPVFAPIPDPAGPGWKVGINKKSDSTDYLQGLVNSQGVARVPAGIYYISKPIRIRAGQGLIGEGADRTVIIAKQPNIDIIIGDEHITKQAPYPFTLADITLQGGRNGIHHDTRGVQFNRIVLSHVTFRDMSESGIFIDGIYGWDNNFIDNVNFYRCGESAVKQRVSPTYIRGDDPGMSYMDKNVFYRCQFVESGHGVDLKARRANNLNAFVDSVFKGNTKSAATMTNNSSTVFANSDFINNGGNPIISNNKPTYFVNSYFRAVKNNVAMLPDDATCEGCVFEKGGSTVATIVAEAAMVASVISDSPKIFLYNSKSIDMPLGGFRTGILVNTFLAGDKPLNHQAAFIRNGDIYVLAPGLPKPSGQFLFRRNY